MTNPLLGRRLILLALLAMLLGILLPFLMIIGTIESTFFLNFLAFTLSVAGLFTGIVAITTYTARPENRDKE